MTTPRYQAILKGDIAVAPLADGAGDKPTIYLLNPYDI
jgi:hypothetical protein